MFQKKAEKKLWIKQYCNDLHFFLFSIALLFLSLKYPIFFILLILYLIFIIKKTKYFIPITFIMLITFVSFYFHKAGLNELSDGIYEGKYIIIDKNENTLTLKGETKLLIYYNYNDLNAGDIIEAKIKISEFDLPSYSTDFNQKEYYFSKKITNKGKIIAYEKVGEVWNIGKIKAHILDFYEKKLGKKTFKYVKNLFFGISDLDSSTKKAYSSLYLSHLLAISGMHILFYYKILLCIFQRIFRIRGEKITILLLGIYILFLGFKASAMRAFLFLILSYVNQKAVIKYTKLDILSISFILMGILMPLQVYQMGFILSFIISFVLLFMEDYTYFVKGFKKHFMTSLLCILSILPFLINQTNEIAIGGIILASPLNLVFSKSLLPLILCILIIPIPIYEFLFLPLDSFLLYLANWSFPISMPSFQIWMSFLYYLVFIGYLILLIKIKNKLYPQILIFCLLVFAFSLRFINPFYRITFIDVGQGDSILIELPKERGSVLIDSFNDNVSYLKSIGLKKIDYLILTHFDVDHIGSTEEVLDQFQVGCVIYSIYEDSTKIKNLNCEKQMVKSGDVLQVSNLSLYVFGPIQKHNDRNSNSIVLYFKIYETSFLLTGDMTKEEEKDLIQKYGKNLKSDFLKVGHHGSNTSSSLEFLDVVAPKYSIISVGKNNSYGLPDERVIKRLEEYSEIYTTKDRGNIKVFLKEDCYIKTFR